VSPAGADQLLKGRSADLWCQLICDGMAEDGLPPLQQVLPRENSAVGQTGAHPGDPGSCVSHQPLSFSVYCPY
jgi:hypothetical protein